MDKKIYIIPKTKTEQIIVKGSLADQDVIPIYDTPVSGGGGINAVKERDDFNEFESTDWGEIQSTIW